MKNKPELLILILALLATAAKVYCAWTTFGTVDLPIFYRYAKFLAEYGVIEVYRVDDIFNHPPLLGNYLGLAYEMAGGKGQPFALLLRLPGIIADLAVVLGVMWVRRQTGRPDWWAIALLAVSPISFMISGYHGNFDSLIPLGLMVTALACINRQALLSGVLLGLACQVKIIPLLMAPVLFFFWLHRGQGRTFFAATVGTLLVGWCAPIIAVPEVFLRQVLTYSSIWGWWGITYLLNISGIPELTGMVSIRPPSPSQALVIHVLKFLIVTGTLILAWRRRKGTAENTLATMGLVWALFFSLSPGFGVQYLAWVSPFLLFYSPRWFAAFTATGSLALFIFYNVISNGIPWQKGIGLEATFGTWGPWLLLPWAVFVAMVVVSRKEFGILPRSENAPSASPVEGSTNESSLKEDQLANP